jgi:penicillin-binding protein 2
MLAEEELKDKMGAIVAMDPRNGEILAMASGPAFNPNEFIGGIERARWQELITNKDAPLQNRPISGQYPPGSVFKIVVALSGLQNGAIDPEEEIFCPGRYTLGSHVFRCWKKYGHGKVNFHKALRESCDVYFYKVGKRLGVDKIAATSKMFGLGRKTGINLDYERGGLVPTSKWKLKRWGVPWQAGETLSLAIGQSFMLVTPLQMANMISAVFNGGVLHTPKVIKWVGTKKGRIYEAGVSPSGRIRAEEKNLALIRRALIGVVNEPHGTGSRSRLKDLVVAGKTGTAQVVKLQEEKGTKDEEEVPIDFRDHAWFVAIAPVDQPRLALAILVEHGGHGGSAAAPIAKKMLETYLGKG